MGSDDLKDDHERLLAENERLLAENERLLARVAELESEDLLADPNLRRLATAVPDNIMLLDGDCRIRFINWTVPELSVEEVIGTVPWLYTPVADRQQVEDTYRDVLRTGEPARLASVYRTDDGVVTQWDSHAIPLVHEDRVDGLILISTNITARDEAARDRDRFFDLSLDILCVLSLTGVFKRLSPAFERVLGWPVEEVLGTSHLDLVHPSDLEATKAAMTQLQRGLELIDFENRYRAKDGSYHTLQWRAIGVPDQDTVYSGARDVTEQRALEQQLRHSQKMDAIGQLAGGLAHDFNNHLLAIMMNADYALKHAVDEPVVEHLARVKDGARRAAELTRQLLTFSRKHPLQFAPVDVNELVESLLRMIQRTIPENIELSFSPGIDLPLVAGDVSQLEQVVLNLCINARDALPSGGRIRIATSELVVAEGSHEVGPCRRPGRFVVLRVEDDGVGMTPEVKERLFEPFFTTKPQGMGTGLGLATAYGIVQQHRGVIDVASTAQVGTTVCVYLEATDGLLGRRRPARRSDAPRGHETILVAEDATAVRNVVIRALEHAGYRVMAASDGQEAVDIAREHGDQIALALLDVVMPRLDGPDAASAITEAYPNIRILFTTGYSDRKAIGAHVRSRQVVRKPYELDDLLFRIRHTLDAQPPQPSNSQ